jgi:PEP-CTERM motif-containing protein
MKVTDLRRKLAAALVAGGMLIPGAIVPGAASAADLNTNLVTNAGFENVDLDTLGGVYNTPAILDWSGSTSFSYAHAGGGGVGPDYANGGPLSGGGQYYFTANGSDPDATAPGDIYQDIDVSAGASGSLIASGSASYQVSAFFSSYSEQGDYGGVHVEFLDSGSGSLGTGLIEDSDTTAWTQSVFGGGIPIGTETVRVSVLGTALSGGPDGYIDNVDLQVIDFYFLPTLDLSINRDDGSLLLSNNTGSAVNLSGYSITSNAGSLAPAAWISIADNYDAGSPGPDQVDPNNDWSELTDSSSQGDLSEADLDSALGTSFAPGSSINLSDAGAWMPSQFEDLLLEYVSDGQVVAGLVAFNGNGDQPYAAGDLNVDGAINVDDWVILRANQHSDLTSLALADAARLGDLTGDGANDHADFVGFKQAFDAANGAGSFAAMIAAVPEPSTLLLLLSAGLFALPAGRRENVGKE